MRTRKLNPDRIRRHMARSTPDEIRTYIDPLEDDAQEKYRSWVRNFGKQMKIKYGHDVRIDVYIEDTFPRNHRKLIIARMLKEKS
jgi:hypothetical protein